MPAEMAQPRHERGVFIIRRSGESPVEAMRGAHADKLRLCDALEAIADTLPGSVDRMQCLAVASELVPLLRAVHLYEERFVFPLYEAARGADGETQVTGRLKAEHVEDECFADELTETLLAIGRGGPIGNAEAVGFMLRGFFETLRRHIAFEREHIMPLVERASPPAR